MSIVGPTPEETRRRMRSIPARDMKQLGARLALHCSDVEMRNILRRWPELDPAQNPDDEYRSKCWVRWMKENIDAERYIVTNRNRI